MFQPIGFVKADVMEKVDENWGEAVSEIVVNSDLAEGLEGLDGFSHAMILYHLNEAKFVKEKHLQRRPQGRDDMPMVGIFAQRAKDRPNSIGVTTVKILSVQQSSVRVQGLDAINGTPVLDIKPYYPHYDMKEDAVVPDWVNILMEHYF